MGDKRGFEIELPQGAGTDKYSTGDVWATIYRGGSGQTGADVGLNCTDDRLHDSRLRLIAAGGCGP